MSVRTAAELTRATMARQLLLRRESLDVVDAVRRVVALQAQEPASPYVALWNRVAGFDPAALDAALAGRALVKASLMRVTLHLVAADEHGTFHEAMRANLRASRLHDRRYRDAGLTIADADAALPALLEAAAEPRTGPELVTALAGHLGTEPDERLWWALRTFAPLVRVPDGRPWGFGAPIRFETAPRSERPEAADALPRLVRRYLEGFGPATIGDFCQFALQRKAQARPAFDALADELVTSEGPAGELLYDVVDGVVPPADTPVPPRLLGMWDSVLLAYEDRRRVMDDAVRREVIRRNGDTLPTVLVDGRVEGVWRPAAGGVEVTVLGTVPGDAWPALDAEARDLVRLLADREPTAYAGYGRWWEQLPTRDRRVIGT